MNSQLVYGVGACTCPHCGDELKLEGYVYRNATSYQKSVNAATLCCGKPITGSPISGLIVEKNATTETTDDWGCDYAK